MTSLLALQLLALVVGIAVCTAGGLLALVPNTERPLAFVPIYGVTVTLFAAGLAVIFWFQPIGRFLAERL
ncbi:MAG: hypothetical protein ACREJB_17440 [Planctomycetaceae bacterium]